MKNLSDTATIDPKEHAKSTYTFDDRIIPLKECGEDLDVAWRENTVKQYCPEWRENDFLYGNFYT